MTEVLAIEWADRNTSAFLRGYVDNSGRTADGSLSPQQDLILRAYMSEDFREGMDAFLNKRTPQWKGQ